MASTFFRSIPAAIVVKEPYEEVFSLFTTETTDAPWAHNRSVSQQSTRLEVELDFTPAPSPVISQPGSRPDSGSGSYSSATTTFGDTLPGASSLEIAHGTKADFEEELGQLDQPSSPQRAVVSLPKAKSPAARAIIGNRRAPSRTVMQQQQPNKKPFVIHQSLSTLSQPGQTGTVVWDSSILMAKFLLSIRGLTLGCYRTQQGMERRVVQQAQEVQEQYLRRAQQEQIRKLEEQAEHLTVSAGGDLEVMVAEEEGGRKKWNGKGSIEGNYAFCNGRGDLKRDGDTDSDVDDDDDDDDDDSDSDGSDEGRRGQAEEELQEQDRMLVFDPAETTVLELGSGCGLLGIVMAELCQDLLLTDQKPVLPLLVKNLRKNLDRKYFDQDLSDFSATTLGAVSSSGSISTRRGSKKESRPHHNTSENHNEGPYGDCIKPCNIQVQELVWGQDLDQNLKRGFGLDYVVATDVVYNESVVPKLVHTLKELCEIRERVYEACKRGYGEQFDRFEDALYQKCSMKKEKEDNEAFRRRLSQIRKRKMSRTVVLLGQELRADYVHLTFLEKLEQAGFRIVRMPKSMMDPEYQSGYVIYAFYLRRKK